MAVSARALALVIEELVLDGVAPDEPAVRESIERALVPPLAHNGLAQSAQHVVAAVTSAVTEVAAT